MSLDTIGTEIVVSTVMNSPVVTLERDKPVLEAAKLMKRYKVGSVIIVNAEETPIGILTKTDVIDRLLAKEKDSRKVKAEEIMSSPLITVEPQTKIQDAVKIMRMRKVSRLGVVYKKKLVGILSVRDVIRVTPEIMDILSEKVKIKAGEMTTSRGSPIIGYCDNCGDWSDSLVETDGNFYCPDCTIDLYGETRGRE
ncbi:MAG: CBS domain-containing protein [Candidatus Geothermarchaeales archaeon]